MGSYSIDIMKKSTFNDELMNVLEVLPPDQVDEDILVIIEYLKRRVKEIDKEYK